jgi:hypothetical protein
MSNKSSVQINENNVVIGVLTDSKGNVPTGNIPLANNVDINNILDTKYDSSAETSNDKTAVSFVKPSEGKYFDENGVEQNITTP